jgi:hypothetical protein
MSKNKQKNIIVLIFFILGIILIGLSIQKIQQDNVQIDNSDGLELSENKTEEIEIEQDVSEKNISEISEQAEPNEAVEDNISFGDLNFDLIISDQVFESSFSEGQTLYEAMNQMKDIEQISFEEKDFSGLGSYMYSINGVEENKREGLYWIYYINGKQANIGVSNYILKDGDQIKWQLEPNIY